MDEEHPQHDHVVLSRDGRLICLNCKAEIQLTFPAKSLAILATMREFTRQHKNCPKPETAKP